MDKTFKLSLLYLLLIIPQHGNSPIPRMESWMEMDQGDGFVDRDLTSSLTGAESFGSAHKNYQNALIRKKQADTEDELESEGTMNEFSARVADRMQRRAAITPGFMPDQYAGYGYNNYLGSSGQNQFAYRQSIGGMNGYENQRYRMPMTNVNERGGNVRFDGRFPSPSMAEMMDPPLTSKNVRSLRMRKGNGQGKDNEAALSVRSGNCSPRGSGKFDHARERVNMVNREGDSDEREYIPGSEDIQSRMTNELGEDDLRDVQIEGGEEQDENLLAYNKADEDDLGIDESDYYGEGKDPALMRGDIDIDYNQINPHGIIYKREETKARGDISADGGEEVSQSSMRGEGSGKMLKDSRSLLKAEAPKEGRDITKDVVKGALHSNVVWSGNPNLKSKELETSMGEAHKVFGEVQLSQEKLPAKSQYYHDNVGWKTDNYAKMSSDERRNKREDEDEQKNMKTGTDEGGGEYEDEEGKGHNDEEEYYEEADVSGGRGIRVETALSGHQFNHKLCKRETGKDEEEKGLKGREAIVDISSQDYQLNLENAPVEHGDNKKSSWREGTNRKKNVSRRGMKIWDEWGKWSPCSVTCGVGRKTRWRHCIGGGCARGEKEALIKKCTYPAC